MTRWCLTSKRKPIGRHHLEEVPAYRPILRRFDRSHMLIDIPYEAIATARKIRTGADAADLWIPDVVRAVAEAADNTVVWDPTTESDYPDHPTSHHCPLCKYDDPRTPADYYNNAECTCGDPS